MPDHPIDASRYLAQAKVLLDQGDGIGLAGILAERAVALSALAGIRALLEEPSYELETLNRHQREIYVLIVRGYTTTDIGAIHDMPIARVKHNARVIQQRLAVTGLDGIRKHFFLRLRTVASRITIST